MFVTNVSRKFYLFCGSPKTHITFLVIISSIILFWNLGENSFRHLDEAIFVQVSKEILSTGDWIAFHIRGAPFFHKSPLRIWLNSIAFILFGTNEFSARLWSAVSSLITVLIVYLLAKNIYGKKTGLLASLILLLSNQFIFERCSRSAEEDATVVLFICLTLYFFWLSRKREVCIYISSIFVGLAFMTKNTLALFPILFILLFIITTKGFKLYNLKTLTISLFIILTIVLPWHILQFFIFGENFFKIYLVEFLYFLNPSLLLKKNFFTNFITLQIIDRIRQSSQVSPFCGPWYYIYTIIIGFFPWSIVLPFAIFYIFKIILHNKNDSKAKDVKGDILILYWLILPLILLSLLHIKRTWRINLIYPAMAIIIARFFVDSFGKKNFSIHAFGIILVSAFIINLFPNQWGLPYYTFCPWLEYQLNFLILNIPHKYILKFNSPYPGFVIIVSIAFLFLLYTISKNKIYFTRVISGYLLGYLLISSGINCLYLVNTSTYKSDMHIISKRLEKLSRLAPINLIVFEDGLFRMQFGKLRPEYPSQFDNWADFYYLNNIKNVNLHFIQEYKNLNDMIIQRRKNSILLLTDIDNFDEIKYNIPEEKIKIILIKGKFVLLNIPS